LTTEVVDKQIFMDTETGNMNISQDAQQKIMRLRYLALYSVDTFDSLLKNLSRLFHSVFLICIYFIFAD
jgi:hypothetical protein